MTVVISGAFAIEFYLEDEWNKYRKENGIENPWNRQREFAQLLKPLGRKGVRIKLCDGVGEIEVPGEEYEATTAFNEEGLAVLNSFVPSDEERIAYRRQEYLWKGSKILPQVSWDEFLRWVAVREGINETDFRPCDAKDKRCNFFCPRYGGECNE